MKPISYAKEYRVPRLRALLKDVPYLKQRRELQQQEIAKRLYREKLLATQNLRRAELQLRQTIYECLALTMNGLSLVGLYILSTPNYSIWLNLGAVAVMIGTVLLYLQNKRLRRKFCAVFTKK